MIKFEKKYLYTFVDEEEVQELIGKKGIFFDEPIGDYDLENKPLYVLTRFSPKSPTPFEFEVKGDSGDIENCDSTFFYYDPNLECKRAYYLENKKIQWRNKDFDWDDCIGEPCWNEDTECRIKPETQPIENDTPKEDHREYNIGDSDYSQYSYQVWDIWRDFKLNAWEADIVKRSLRKKEGEENDFEKIRHILTEMIDQTENEYLRLYRLMEKIKTEYKLNKSQLGWISGLLLFKSGDYLCRLYDLKRNIFDIKGS